MPDTKLAFTDRPIGSPVEVVTVNVHVPQGIESEDIEGAIRKGFAEKDIPLRYFSVIRSSQK